MRQLDQADTHEPNTDKHRKYTNAEPERASEECPTHIPPSRFLAK